MEKYGNILMALQKHRIQQQQQQKHRIKAKTSKKIILQRRQMVN